ncbi:MAG: excinuclease ABC subunit UvrC [Xanthomonadales bacterium]|nr:excinuclease ABC subunit UvrC [Gammaproteobacteria bacterium]MBT8075323.1 excinuclease ABC subunit UvrC [Gammaproteobacteria bacterium]NNK03965.1 excinuclease ABC subunit UvrC [Xanthomonadales bacterium]
MSATETGFDGRKFARRLSAGPGVYLMRDAEGSALYVGKAANLRKRVSSYFDARPKIDRIMRMVARIRSIEVSLTRTEAEALLLENEWIKSLKPRYNVLLRDDKSYPWVMFGTDHEFPRIAFHRGGKDKKRVYLGPYPSASSVRESINLIQKLFLLRNCEDSYFSHRTRPCLQYQIKRCTAPCVDKVEAAAYSRQVEDALLFLRGNSQKVITRLIRRMEKAAELQQYEQAAQYRDQINHLKQMQARQFVSAGNGDLDIIALAKLQRRCAIEVISVRGGRSLGQRDYFPSQSEGHSEGEILQAFLGQFYRVRTAPPELIISHSIEQQELFESVFSERSGRKVRIQSRPRSHRKQWLELAGRNALNALHMRSSETSRISKQFEAMAELLSMAEVPETIECFDISHTSGHKTVASCVVFGADGPVKSRYRRYNLKGFEPGDDYAAMREVLRRRYRKLQKDEGHLPDLVIVDGGKGQLGVALEALAECGLTDIPLMGVAKGPSRRAGYEEWVLPVKPYSLRPGPESSASHLVQQVRDEAHRFAITGHRGRRQKAVVHSVLEDIPGVGARRRRALLTHFGGIQGVRKAGVEELAGIPGINRQLAARIFKALH